MGLSITPLSQGRMRHQRLHHNRERRLLSRSKTPVEKDQKGLAQENEKGDEKRRATEGFGASGHQRHLVRALDWVPVEGRR